MIKCLDPEVKAKASLAVELVFYEVVALSWPSISSKFVTTEQNRTAKITARKKVTSCMWMRWDEMRWTRDKQWAQRERKSTVLLFFFTVYYEEGRSCRKQFIRLLYFDLKHFTTNWHCYISSWGYSCFNAKYNNLRFFIWNACSVEIHNYSFFQSSAVLLSLLQLQTCWLTQQLIQLFFRH